MAGLYKRGKVYWIVYYVNRRKYSESLKTSDPATAKYLRAKKEAEIAENKAILPSQRKTDIRTLLEEYRGSGARRKAADTHQDDISRIRKYLDWAGIRTLGEITEKNLQEYLNYRLAGENPISLTTANRVITNLKTFLNFAVRRRYLHESPLRQYKKYRVPENPGRFLTREEIAALLAAARDPSNYVDGDQTLYPLLAAAVYTGMRRGELFSLEWPNIDFTRDIIMVLNKPGFTIKTKKFRSIPLSAELKRILGEYRKPAGRCFDTTNHRRILQRVMRAAGLPGVGWRELRRTLASHLAMKGVSLLKIAKWYGHSTPMITYRHYAHLAPETTDNDINAL